MKWERVELGNLTKITSGGTPSRKKPEYYSNGNIPWVKTGDLKSKEIFEASEFITELGLNSSSAKLFPQDTVLVALYGATIGACSILRTPAATNQACAAILPSDKLDENYLFYFLSYFKPQLIKAGVGGAQPNISGKIIKETQIPLPPLPEQRRLAARLDKADALRQKSRAVVETYAELGRSVFLEVFGDPVRNEKGWEVVELGKLTSKVSSGITPKGGSKIYKTEGVLFLRSQNVLMNSLDLGNAAYVTPELHEKMKRTWVKYKDVLLNITGASIGRVAVFEGENDSANVNQHVCIIRPLKDKLNPVFLSYLIGSENFQRRELSRNTGGTREAFNYKQIKAFQIPLPPLDLQTRFAGMVANIEAQRRLAERQLEAAEAVFGGVLQGAFG